MAMNEKDDGGFGVLAKLAAVEETFKSYRGSEGQKWDHLIEAVGDQVERLGNITNDTKVLENLLKLVTSFVDEYERTKQTAC